MALKITTTIDTSGPFFERDPKATLQKNLERMLEAAAAEGEADVKAQLRAGEAGRRRISHGVTPDRLAGHVIGRVRSLKGRGWGRTAVVSINNTGLTRVQGIALMAAAAQLEGRTHVFRRTSSRLRRARAINVDELLDGLE